MKLDYRAKLIIHDADKIDDRDLSSLTRWLRDTAKFIEKERRNLSKRFTSRCMK